jgi:hypothetical protein
MFLSARTIAEDGSNYDVDRVHEIFQLLLPSLRGGECVEHSFYTYSCSDASP